MFIYVNISRRLNMIIHKLYQLIK